MAVRHTVSTDVPPKTTVGTCATAPSGISREEDRAEHGLQLQVSRTIEHEAVSPISGDEPQQVKATAAVHAAIVGDYDDDAMIAKELVEFG